MSRRTGAEAGAAGVGVFFAACAVGHAIGTLPRSRTAMEWFRDSAWLPPWPALVGRLVPVAGPYWLVDVPQALLYSGPARRLGAGRGGAR